MHKDKPSHLRLQSRLHVRAPLKARENFYIPKKVDVTMCTSHFAPYQFKKSLGRIKKKHQISDPQTLLFQKPTFSFISAAFIFISEVYGSIHPLPPWRNIPIISVWEIMLINFSIEDPPLIFYFSRYILRLMSVSRSPLNFLLESFPLSEHLLLFFLSKCNRNFSSFLVGLQLHFLLQKAYKLSHKRSTTSFPS